MWCCPEWRLWLCVGDRCAVSPRSLARAEHRSSAAAGARQPLAAAHSPSGSRDLCLLCSAAQPLQPALLPQSSSQNTLGNSLDTPAFWPGRQQERRSSVRPPKGQSV